MKNRNNTAPAPALLKEIKQLAPLFKIRGTFYTITRDLRGLYR